MNLGETIYRLRTERNMSQGALADALDVSRQSVSKWENNAAVPELDKLLKMSQIFGVTLDALVGREAPTPPPQTPAPETVIREATPPHRTVGVILLCFGLLTTLLLSILGGFYLGVMAGLPFTLVGCVLISSSENLFFRCAWAIFAIYAPLCYYFILNFIGYGLYISIGIFSVWFSSLAVVTIVMHHRGKFSAGSRKFMVGSIIIALALLLLLGGVNRWMMYRSGLYTDVEELASAAIDGVGY